MQRTRDCQPCRGTGIGYPPPDGKCFECGGRGYFPLKEGDPCPDCGSEDWDKVDCCEVYDGN